MYFFHNFRSLSKIFQFFVKRLPEGLPKLKCTFLQEILEGKFSVEKSVCVIFFQKWAKNFRPSGEFFFGSVVKTAFDVSIISLWETFFGKIQILFSILASWANPFRHSVEDFRAGLLENTILFFNHFRIMSEQFPLFWRKKCSRAAKTVF